MTTEYTLEQVKQWLRLHPTSVPHYPVNEAGVNSKDGSFYIFCAEYGQDGKPTRPLVAMYSTPEQEQPEGFCEYNVFCKAERVA